MMELLLQKEAMVEFVATLMPVQMVDEVQLLLKLVEKKRARMSSWPLI